MVLQLKRMQHFSKFILGVPVLRRGKPHLRWTLSHLQRELIIASTPHCGILQTLYVKSNATATASQWISVLRSREAASIPCCAPPFCFRRAMGDAQTSQSGCVPSNWIALQCSEQWLTPEGGILGRIFVAIFDLKSPGACQSERSSVGPTTLQSSLLHIPGGVNLSITFPACSWQRPSPSEAFPIWCSAKPVVFLLDKSTSLASPLSSSRPVSFLPPSHWSSATYKISPSAPHHSTLLRGAHATFYNWIMPPTSSNAT